MKTNTKIELLALGLLLAGFARATDYAASVTISDAASLPADGIFNVTAAGATVTVDVGIADGETSLTVVKQGVGRLVLNKANTFTGGLTVKGGYVVVNHADAMGCGIVRFEDHAEHQVFLNVEGATFTNDVEFADGISRSDQEGDLGFGKSCTYAGRIYTRAAGATGGFQIGGKGVKATGIADCFSGTVRFTQPITIAKSVWFRLYSYGTMTFDERVTMPNGNFDAAYSAQGTLVFNAPENDFNSGTEVKVYNALIKCGAENALSNFYWQPYTYAQAKNIASLDLNGYNQRLRAVSYSVPGSDVRGDDENRQWMLIRSSSLAYVTVTGLGANKTSYLHHGFWDKAGLVLDADPAYTFVQTNRHNTTTASLLISNGVFRIGANTTFAKVPAVYVGANGRFECLTDQALALKACTSLGVDGDFYVPADGELPFAQDALDLVLGPDAELSLPADTELRVLSLRTVDAKGNVTVQPIERYTSSTLAQIKSGTVFVAPQETTTATWTGGGASTSIGTPENWSTAPELPDFNFASLVATFASGGTEALVDRNAFLSGLVFDAPNDFTLKSDGEHVVTLGPSGLTVSGGDHVYTVEPRVDVSESAGGDWTLQVPENGRLRLLGGLNQSGNVTQTGGALELEGTNRIDGKFSVNCSNLVIAGTLTQTGGPVAGHVKKTSVPADAFYPVFEDTTHRLVLNGATIEKQTSARGCFCQYEYRKNWLTVASNTVNRFLSGVYVYVPQTIVLQDGASLEFKGPFDYDGGLTFGTDDMRDAKPKPTARARVTFSSTVEGPTFALWGGVTLRFAAAGCKFAMSGVLRPLQLNDGYSLTNSVAEFTVDHVIEEASTVQIGYCGRVDLFATKQYWPDLSASGGNKTVITGLPGSELQVANGTISGKKLEDALSIRACGTNGSSFVIANVVATSCGDISVDSGKLAFDANSSWLNGRNVTVRGTGRLEIAHGKTFGKKLVTLTLADSGVLSIPEGEMQAVNALYHDGERMPAGVYGSAESGAPDQSLADHFAGKGRIRVRGGFAILLR